MFTKDDIIARLMNGESADDIAQEIANTLNEAEAEYKDREAEAKRKAEEEAKEKERAIMLREAKVRAAEDMIDALCDYATAAEDDEMLKELQEVKMEDVVDMLDSLIDTSKALRNLKHLHFDIPVGKDDAIADLFTKMFG